MSTDRLALRPRGQSNKSDLKKIWSPHINFINCLHFAVVVWWGWCFGLFCMPAVLAEAHGRHSASQFFIESSACFLWQTSFALEPTDFSHYLTPSPLNLLYDKALHLSLFLFPSSPFVSFSLSALGWRTSRHMLFISLRESVKIKRTLSLGFRRFAGTWLQTAVGS